MDPKGNFPVFDAANLNIVTAHGVSGAPTEVVVRNSGVIGPNSATGPLVPHGWANLSPGGGIAMGDPLGTGRGSTFDFNANVDIGRPGHKCTKTHAVNSKLAIGSNVVGNIFVGRQLTNMNFGQWIETAAQGIIKYESWQQQVGKTLANSLNNAEKIGKNAAGQYYYHDNGAGGAAVFPAMFYDNATLVPDNTAPVAVNRPAIKQNELEQTYAMEYIAKPQYNLLKANLIANIQGVGDAAYLALHGDNKETFPVAPGSAIETAADTIADTFADRVKATMDLYVIDITQIANGAEVTLDNLDWKKKTHLAINRPTESPGAFIRVVAPPIGGLGRRRRQENTAAI